MRYTTSLIRRGLTAVEVQERIRRRQVNTFQIQGGRTYLQIARDNVVNLFNFVVGALLIILISRGEFVSAFFAGFAVVTNSFIGLFQEVRAKQKLNQLSSRSSFTANALRGGEWVVISEQEIVLDDVLRIEAGDRIPVDGTVLSSEGMEIDESAITGESFEIPKDEDDILTSGSFCVSGTGIMVVTAVGDESTLNRMAIAAQEYRYVETPTQMKVRALLEITIVVMFVLGPMLYIAGMVQGISFLEQIENLTVFVTSLVPQGAVLIAVLSLSLGAFAMGRQRMIIQRVNSVESLAHATVICLDKTGTLTENDLHVQEIIPLGDELLDDLLPTLAAYMQQLTSLNLTSVALKDYLEVQVPNVALPHEKLEEIPFKSRRKWGGMILDHETQVMGAPEVLLGDIHPSVSLQVKDLSEQGLRVIAFGSGQNINPDADLHTQITPRGLIVLRNQLRPNTKEVIANFLDETQIRFKLLSGDSIETVRAVAEEAGVEVGNQVYSGAEVDAMSQDELNTVVQQSHLFARQTPESKRRIIRTLQDQGGYVAMVGDGVNDVQALKQANLSITFESGAQIAKDIADIVLESNDLSNIFRTFREGRNITQVIFSNLKLFLTKMSYTIAWIVFVGFMFLPFPIKPVQISWVGFGTTNIWSTLIAFGFVKPKMIRSYRRDVAEYMVKVGMVSATAMAAVYAAVYYYAGIANQDPTLARSVVTVHLSIVNTFVAWHVIGMDFARPATWVKHWRGILVTALLNAVTVGVMFFDTQITAFFNQDKPMFAFVWSDDPVVTLILVGGVLVNFIVLAIFMRLAFPFRQIYRMIEVEDD